MAITFTKLYIGRFMDGSQVYLGSSHFTPKGTWDDTSSYVKKALSKYKRDDTQLFNATLGSTTTQPYKSLVILAVSDPLDATTFSMNLDVILGALGSTSPSTPNTFFWALHVWVSQGNANTVRNTLLSNYTESSSNAFPDPSPSAIGLASAQTLSGTCEKGDRLIVEIGWVQRTVPGGSISAAVYYGSDKDDSELAVSDTQVTTRNGGITFSSAITLATPDNTDVLNAVDVTFPFDVSVDVQYALQEVGSSGEFYEPYNQDFDYEFNSVWYKYVADFDGDVYISTEGSGGANVQVDVFKDYTAAQLKTSTPDGDSIATMIDPTDDTPLVVTVVNGSTYFIRVSYNGNNFPDDVFFTVNFKMQDSVFGVVEPPPNEACDNAIEIIDLPFAATVNSLGSTIDVITPCGTIYNTVWYKYKPMADMMMGIHTANTEVFTPYGGSYRPVLIGIWQSTNPNNPEDCSQLILMKCSQGGVGYKFLAGKTYFVCFGSIVDGGYEFLNIYWYPHDGEYHENFNEFSDEEQLFGGDFYLSYHNNSTFGVLSPTGWGPDGSRAIKGIGCVGGSPFCVAKQTNYRAGLLVMDGRYGYVEADIWVGETDEPPADGRGFLALGVFGQWDPSNRNEFEGGPDWTVKPLELVDLNTSKGFQVWTFTTGEPESLEQELTLFTNFREIDGPSKFLRYHFDPPIYITPYISAGGDYHRWRLAWRISTHVGGEPQPDGIVEVWVDGELIGRLCDVKITTDIGDQWNGVLINPHGAVDNVDVYDQNVVTPCEVVCPCPPNPNQGPTPGAGGTEPPPTEPFKDFPPPDCEVLGVVGLATDPNLGESWCE